MLPTSAGRSGTGEGGRLRERADDQFQRGLQLGDRCGHAGRAARHVVPLSSSGAVSICSSSGSPEMAVDVSGWIGGASSAGGATFLPAPAPTRICDTRSNVGYTTECTGKALGPGGSLQVDVVGWFS
ncbi:MAG: hypothetical protein ACYCUF_07150 [Acidimicrobiales bacterium]|nr:hypothetical protein [Actinomycetota bacterium]